MQIQAQIQTRTCAHTHTHTNICTRTQSSKQVSMNILFVYLSKLFTHFESEHILQRISILPRNKRHAEQAVQAEEEEEEPKGEEEQAAQG